MKRRVFILSGLLSMFPLCSARAEEITNPFAKVGPFANDAKSVFAFFSFTCSYCQKYQSAVASWGRSIPKRIHFEQVPVVVDRETFNAARAYYAAKKADPSKSDAFLLAALNAAQVGYADMTSKEIVRAAGIDPDAYEKALFHLDVKRAIQRAADMTSRYQIAVTPSLAIGGQMVIHADYVSGDYGMLMRLASGFVSRILENS